MRVFGCEARPRNESEHAAAFRGLTADRFLGFTLGSEFEHSCCFDGFGEDMAACPGCQSPGKTTGKFHNCQFKHGTGCVSLGFTHLREWQPA